MVEEIKPPSIIQSGQSVFKPQRRRSLAFFGGQALS
jgi:hypothetical protein